ncbi:inactive serine/threonine-protein kinase VRK3 isoform X2 [Rissa tridactyla]|uniref:inactive serine/threonine-protein kinase VRK3 isoform X2 n=1 Tax=Rissa tridactyla TaxID=75485 RepID=UPI0023BB0C96|nr:inactive serine/threonine-protein kinase VRK3 isoform X2 [Rissa tridactyla]
MAGRGRQGLAAAERPRCETAGASSRGSRFCPQCGRGVEPVFRFCPACGGRLPPPPREEETEQAAPAPPRQQAHSPAAPPPGPPARAPARPGGRSPRKARCVPAVPLPAEAVLTDWGGRQWRLVRLLEQGGCGLMYEAQAASGTCPQKQSYSLKLDVKDGKIYNEQNFFQRAAKAGTVEKWKKWHSVPLLGIPNCLGFGLHADSYRFLVFSDLGRTLQSVLNDGLYLLREKAAFQIVVRLLDCLEYIHENEYVHGDVTAENIYLNPTDLTQVTLAGYCFAFRYCPGGKHVAQREGSRTPHEGTIEFISLDSHKGAGPSRRSDLESLGYCLLKWLSGSLPWSDELDKVESVVEKKEKYKGDVTCLLRVCFRQRPIPDALQSYLQQVMALEYEEKPCYEGLRQLFKKPLEKMKSSAYDPVDIKMVP